MCESCPAPVWVAARKIRSYADANDHVIVGGLHIVIEDENVTTHDIEWCKANAELDAESREIAALLLAMTVPERHMAVQLAWTSDVLWDDMQADRSS